MNPAPTNPNVTSDRSDMAATVAPGREGSQSGQPTIERRRRRWERSQDGTIGRFSRLRNSKSPAAARQSIRRSLDNLRDFMASCRAAGATVRGQRLLEQLEAELYGAPVDCPTELLELRRAAFAADQNEDHCEHEVDLVGMKAETLRRWVDSMVAENTYNKQCIRWGLAELERIGDA